MSLENYTGNISDLVVTNPTPTDPKSQGDDHLRGIKYTLRQTFPNFNGPTTQNPGQITPDTVQIGDGPSAETHFWDGSVANQLTLKRGTPDAPGSEVLKVVNGVMRSTGGATPPSAGQVGEILSVTGGAGALGALVVANMNSMTIPIGVWDVQVSGGFSLSAGSSDVRTVAISPNSASLTGAIAIQQNSGPMTAGFEDMLASNIVRIVLTVPTLYYMVCRAGVADGSMTSTTGLFSARRVA